MKKISTWSFSFLLPYKFTAAGQSFQSHPRPPPEWTSARVCLVYKKGDKQEPVNYCPVFLIQTFFKLSAAWQCSQLKALTQKDNLVHPCPHGDLKIH